MNLTFPTQPQEACLAAISKTKRPQELKVGQIIFCVDTNDSYKVYPAQITSLHFGIHDFPYRFEYLPVDANGTVVSLKGPARWFVEKDDAFEYAMESTRLFIQDAKDHLIQRLETYTRLCQERYPSMVNPKDLYPEVYNFQG